ncbi:cytochrome c oxidase assembly protein [Lysinibacillus sp. SGAir0095]|uniref:cytochrome c oxidase assembly protein n=1 Tax=Lysinibacillus sp. SGAir0095 TaxID=2070463 RepID=UPI0026C39813
MHNHEGVSILNSLVYVWLLLFIISYIVFVFMTNKTHKKWPIARIVFWIMGTISVSLSIIGPIAEKAHVSFAAHMITHLLLGMFGPLLIVLSAPMTLLLRSVPVVWGRFLSKVLKSGYVQWITHPIIASILNAGGLWILYSTDLYTAMHSSSLLHILVHVHVFLAGYVFTLSMIYIEVTSHRTSFQLRAIVLIIAMAAHSILSKWIYANPPVGVETADAQLGGMLMYYGGDAIDLMIVIILCSQYFRGKNRATKGRAFTAVKTSEG